ncbi:MAG TPA: HEAT repeat domain-containing protein [Ktedonobacterales bacterium]
MERRNDIPRLAVHICTPTPDQRLFTEALRAWLADHSHRADDLGAAPLSAKLAAARSCDLAVVLLGPTFGVRDPLSSFSHAELEAAAAADAQPGKVLVFAEEGVEAPTTPEQREFIERLRNFTGGTFQTICHTPAELIAQLQAALAVWRPPAPRARADATPAAVPDGAVMISSTGDLVHERDAAYDALVARGLPVIDYLRAASEAVAPLERVVSWAVGCQALLLILGPRYGYISPADGLGVTELEFVTALGAGRPILAFIRPDAETSADADQRQFLERVRALVPPERVFAYTDLVSFRDQVGIALDQLGTPSAHRASALPAVPEAEARRWYRRQLRRWLGRLPHLLRPDGMPLEAVFVSLHEAKSGELAAERAMPSNDTTTIYAQNTQTAALYASALDVDEALRRHARVVLRGDPGAGKSVALRWYAITAPDDVTPVLLRLAAYAHERARGQVRGLLDAVAREEQRLALAPSAGGSAWRAALEQGHGLLLLDGLDEVPSEQQATVVADILEVTAALPPESRVVIATRIAGYTAQLGTSFTVFDVLPLNLDQQRRLVLQWYRYAPAGPGQGAAVMSREEAEARTERLMRLLNIQPKLALWARTPLLLTFLALLAAGAAEGEQPVEATQAVIYRRVLRLILGRWRTLNQQQGGGAWHLWEKEQLLLGLARRGMLEGAGELASTADAETVWSDVVAHEGAALAPEIAAPDLLRELSDEDGALIRLGAGQYTFLHPTFQEYLAASLLGAAESAQRLDVVARRRINARWDALTQLLVSELDRLGRHDDASAVVETLRRGDLQPITPGGERDPLRLALVRAIHAQGDREAPLALGAPGPRLARDWRRWERDAADLPAGKLARRYLYNVPFFMGAAAYPLLSELRQLVRSTESATRNGALWALRALAQARLPGAAETLADAEAEVGTPINIASGMDELLEMLHSPDADRRAFAAARLGMLGGAAAAAVDDLRPLIHDPAPNVRIIAVSTLGHIGPAAARAVPELLASADWSEIRLYGGVLRAIGAIGPAAVAASDTLMRCALFPPAGAQVYSGSFSESLSQIGLTPSARQMLLDAVAPPSDATLRQRALDMLPPLVTMLGLSREFLLELATNDVSGALSFALGRVLAQQAPTDVALTVAALRQTLDQAVRAKNASQAEQPLRLLGFMGAAAAPAVDDLRALLAYRDEPFQANMFDLTAINTLFSLGPVAAPATGDLLRVFAQAEAQFAPGAANVSANDPARNYAHAHAHALLRGGIQALGRIGADGPDGPAVLALLRRWANDQTAEPEMRDAALRSLLALGSAAAPAIAEVRQALDDPRKDVRSGAINALGQMGPAASPALPDLLHRLDNPAYAEDNLSLNVALQTLLPQVTDAYYDPNFRDDNDDIPVIPPEVLAAARAAFPSPPPAPGPSQAPPATLAPASKARADRRGWRRFWPFAR